ncbi:MAG: protein kinase [Planctomycetales bacterium]|nr:protein kinase [Planctomycetales bacterium]
MPPKLPSSERLVEILNDLVSRYPDASEQELEGFISGYPGQANELRSMLPTIRLLAMLQGMATDCETRGSAGPDRTIGDFRLIREIGRGGMGVVYEAEQISLSRRVALKVLQLAGLVDEHRVTRFRNECYAAAQLHHSNIVDVYTVNCEAGIHYYAMRHVAGQNLSQFIKHEKNSEATVVCNSHTMSSTHAESEVSEVAGSDSTVPDYSFPESIRFERIQLAANVGRQAASALAYAHSVGVIHRDIKPSNLLLESSGKVWVTDFGLARVGDNTAMTATGNVVGTLRYMSPEQAAGDRARTDHRSDIYSLGATLFEVVAGRPLHLADSPKELLQQIIRGPSFPKLHGISVGLPRDFETILMKTLAKEPADRYQSAGELADDLQAFIEKKAVTARRPTLAQRFIRWGERNRGIMVASGLAMMVLLIVTTISGSIIYNQNVEWRRKEELLENIREEAGYQRYTADINLAFQALLNLDLPEAEKQLANAKNDTPSGIVGFEWKYLRNWIDQLPMPFGKHNGNAYFVDYSPDGRRIVSCGEDGVRIWDASTKQLLRHLDFHTADVNTVSFSADGRFLLAASDDSRVSIWDAETFELSEVVDCQASVLSAEFLQDGKSLLVAQRSVVVGEHQANTVGIYDLNSRQWEWSLKHGGDWLQSVKVMPVSNKFAACTDDGLITINDLSDGTLLHHVRLPPRLAALAISSDEELLAAAGGNGTLHIWELHDGLEIPLFEFQAADQLIESVSFLEGQRAILISCRDGSARVWRLPENRASKQKPIGPIVYRHANSLWCAKINSQGEEMVTVDRLGQITAWDLRARSVQGHEEASLSEFDGLAADEKLRLAELSGFFSVSPDRTHLLDRRHPNSLAIWDLTNNRIQSEYLDLQEPYCPQELMPTQRCQFSSDGHWFYAADNKQFRFMALSELTPSTDLPALPPQGHLGLVLHPMEPLVAFVDPDGYHAIIMDLKTGSKLHSLSENVSCLAWEPDGHTLVIAHHNGIVMLWSLESKTELERFSAPGQKSIAVSPDGFTFATCSVKDVVLWNRRARRELMRFQIPANARAASVKFSPSGNQLAVEAMTQFGVQMFIWDTNPGSS